METVFVLAAYPTKETLKDGMVQRIAVIDDLLVDFKRVYVNIALKNPLYKKIYHHDDVCELFLNPFFPFFLIFNVLLKAKVVYSHSIHPFKHIPYSFFILKLRKVNIILDAHGVVPEEIKMYGKELKYKYVNWIEKQLFSVLRSCICVSREMIKHYELKYNHLSVTYHLLFTSELLPKAFANNITELASELNISPQDSVIVYCGNTQLWQNIPLMIDVMSNIKQGDLKFLILTGELEKFEMLLKSSGIEMENIILRSVRPEDLNKYYELAHYGLILRDDIPINRVSNPTKMLEYLQFGLTPVVLSAYIGDYYALGYEYIKVEDISNYQFHPMKSAKNVSISEIISKHNNVFNINDLIKPRL